LVAIIVIIALIVRFIFAFNLIIIVLIVVLVLCSGAWCAIVRIMLGDLSREASLLVRCCPSEQPDSVCGNLRVALRGEPVELVT